MFRITGIIAFILRLLLAILLWPFRLLISVFRSNDEKRKVTPALWQALKDARSYGEWQNAAEALNGSDPQLVLWKSEPRGDYHWDTVLQRTSELDETERKWRAKELRNSATYRDLLMPVQSRDVGFITRPSLHEYLWTGTKTTIQDYVAATVRGVRTVRKCEATGSKLDDKNEWFKARRMVLGRTALFLQGGSVFGLSHLGVMKALFENNLLPEVIVGTQAGALMAALVAMRTDEELKELFDDEGDAINLDAFTSRSAPYASNKKVGWKMLAGRLRRWVRTGKVLDAATLEQCIMDNIGDMTFERAWQISGRHLCIALASDAPSTPNMLSWKTSPNVLIRTAALASSEMHPDKCLDMILEKNSRGEIRPWLLNDETPAYRDKRRKKRWPSQKPPVWRVQELWHINHYIISASRPYVLPFSPGTHYWAIHKPGTPGAGLREMTHTLGNILQFFVVLVVLLLRTFRSRPNPVTVGLTSAQEENSITPQRRCKPVQIIPNTSWKDLLAFLRNPTHEEIRHWMRKGEMATWPYIQALHIRMDIEIELHKTYKGDPENKPRRTLADLTERLRQRKIEEQGQAH